MGLQVGHWQIADLPESMSRLSSQTGFVFGSYRELAVNLTITRQTAALLRQHGVLVDLLPATVPDGYRADAFLAIHADANPARAVRGYKIVRGGGYAGKEHYTHSALLRSLQEILGVAPLLGAARSPDLADLFSQFP